MKVEKEKNSAKRRMTCASQSRDERVISADPRELNLCAAGNHYPVFKNLIYGPRLADCLCSVEEKWMKTKSKVMKQRVPLDFLASLLTFVHIVCFAAVILFRHTCTFVSLSLARSLLGRIQNYLACLVNVALFSREDWSFVFPFTSRRSLVRDQDRREWTNGVDQLVRAQIDW